MLTVDTVSTIILPAEPIRAELKNTDMKNKTHYELQSSQATWGPFETKEAAAQRLVELIKSIHTPHHPAASLFVPSLVEVDTASEKVVGRMEKGHWFELTN